MSEKLCVVVPTNRPERMREFEEAWEPLFRKHAVHQITIWDGDHPSHSHTSWHPQGSSGGPRRPVDEDRTLFCRFTDAVRNYGFVEAARLGADCVLTLDDDCLPPPGADPIQEHLDVLAKRVPLNWLNTAHQDSPYLRGAPYGIRAEAPVVVSHGIWTGTPDFDGETQLAMEATRMVLPHRICSSCGYTSIDCPEPPPGQDVPCPVRFCAGVMVEQVEGGVPDTLPYYVGPVPAGVGFAVCGMNLMVRKEALPYLYFAPMGPDSGYPDLHRFADIWMGYILAQRCKQHRWAMYTGGSTIVHTRASDARKNVVAEKLGRKWNERIYDIFVSPDTSDRLVSRLRADDIELFRYMSLWRYKADRFAVLIRGLQK